MLWEILIQFVFRLFLGLAVCMAITSPKEVNCAFFRVHLWVLLGLGTLGSLAISTRQAIYDDPNILLGLAITVTVLSYIGSAIWLYDNHTWGKRILVLIAVLAGVLLLWAHPSKGSDSGIDWAWTMGDYLTGSLLLGSTFAAMLLGHYYLNSPGMKLDPLRLLVGVIVLALVCRSLLSLGGLGVRLSQADIQGGFAWATVAMRWLAGLLGLGGMTWMTWQTLKIPNTQSATGILYVALVFAFLGELASAMLSFDTVVPI